MKHRHPACHPRIDIAYTRVGRGSKRDLLGFYRCFPASVCIIDDGVEGLVEPLPEDDGRR